MITKILTNTKTGSIHKSSTFLVGSFGRGNVGDDVFLKAATILMGNKKFYVNSFDQSLLPAGVEESINSVSTKGFYDLLKKLSAFARVRSITYWGGNVWVEVGGSKHPRSSLYKMLFLNATARLMGKKVYYIGTGADDIKGYSLWLARLSARMANEVILREHYSAKLLNIKSRVSPDIAINIPSYRPNIKSIPNNKKFVIGISMLYHFPDPKADFWNVTNGIGEFIKSLPRDKFRFVLLPLQVNKRLAKDDYWAIDQLREIIPGSYEVEIYPYNNNVEDYLSKTEELHLLIGARLHSNILATLNSIPCIGISYRPKVRAFFESNDIQELCLDINEIHLLSSTFNELYTNYNSVAERFYKISKTNLRERHMYEEFAASHF